MGRLVPSNGGDSMLSASWRSDPKPNPLMRRAVEELSWNLSAYQ